MGHRSVKGLVNSESLQYALQCRRAQLSLLFRQILKLANEPEMSTLRNIKA